ncbi:hypothetical protein QQ045_033578 [Rhodiola kirilowii]
MLVGIQGMMEEGFKGICDSCGGGRFVKGHDGFYYCTDSHHQSLDVMVTGVGGDRVYSESECHHRRPPPSVSGSRAGALTIKPEPVPLLLK